MFADVSHLVWAPPVDGTLAPHCLWLWCQTVLAGYWLVHCDVCAFVEGKACSVPVSASWLGIILLNLVCVQHMQ